MERRVFLIEAGKAFPVRRSSSSDAARAAGQGPLLSRTSSAPLLWSTVTAARPMYRPRTSAILPARPRPRPRIRRAGSLRLSTVLAFRWDARGAGNLGRGLRHAGLTSALALLCLTQALAVRAQNQGTWEAPPETKQLQNPLKTDGNTVERGKRLYRHYCLPCHGETGVGDGALAMRQRYKPANLTLERLNRQVDGEIFWKISKGKSPMPDFQRELSARERWDIVSYVRTLLRLIR
jgi:mono/diheme cytochrome c family protein